MPIGSTPPPSTTSWIQPAKRVTGTASVSTTRTQGLKSIDAKYSAAMRASASVVANPIRSMNEVGPWRGSPGLRRPFRQSVICCTMYSYGWPATPAFSGLPCPFGRWQ